MQKLFKVPLVFLFVAACIGLLLRWHFVTPLSWLKYPFWLHAHSHIMFLGWVFNVLYLAYTLSFLEQALPKRYKVLFIVIQILLVGMLVSFPIQGYALFSITFSTLHIVAVVLYTIWFFNDAKRAISSPSVWFAKASLIFFLISSIGPFSLAPIMAGGLAYTNWYYLAIYFYLHFQYNGVFTFGVLALFLHLLEEKQILFSHKQAKAAGVILFISCFPAYLLSTLWVQPGIAVNIIGAISAVLQIIALFYFVRLVSKVSSGDWRKFSSVSRWLMIVSLTALIIKFVLQLLSAHPIIAQLAYDVRYFIIAYLHLILIGFITFFLIAWYTEKKFIQLNMVTMLLLLVGFAGSQIIMVSAPLLAVILNNSPLWLLIFSVVLTIGIAGVVVKIKV